MTDLSTAAQQALERLMLHHRTWDARDDLNAITALRAALEQPDRAQKMRDAGYTRRPTLREMAEPELVNFPEEKLQAVAEYFGDKYHVWYGIGARDVEEVLCQSVRRGLVTLNFDTGEQPEQAEPVEIKPPNPEGATQCIVRWFAETPAGWVGAWDREALEQFTHPPRRETEPAFDALVAISLLTHLGGEVAEYADVVEAVRRLHALNGELLEALKALCESHSRFSGGVWDKARAAIAKAEGKV